MPALMLPDTRFRRSFGIAASELAREGRRSAELGVGEAGFASFVQAILEEANEATPRPQGRVPATTLWWIDGEEYLGRISIRHRLTAELRTVGGHIGYDVRPTARRRGHATAMLRAALPVARALGIERALITCDAENIGSRRVIEANGGLLEDAAERNLRFWVRT